MSRAVPIDRPQQTVFRVSDKYGERATFVTARETEAWCRNRVGVLIEVVAISAATTFSC